jgi:hypothetical protein
MKMLDMMKRKPTQSKRSSRCENKRSRKESRKRKKATRNESWKDGEMTESNETQ